MGRRPSPKRTSSSLRAAVALESENPDLIVGLVEAYGLGTETATSLTGRLDAVIRARVAQPVGDEVRMAVRDLLRTGGFKPTGRNKPASEYLAKVAGDAFPRIHPAVDALNLVSLDTGIPISLLDLPRALEGADGLEIREGYEGESFVFNASGQVIDVRGLLSTARQGGPALANPVKDSMATKLSGDSRDVLAVLYATRRIWSPDDVAREAQRLADLLREHAGARETNVAVLSR